TRRKIFTTSEYQAFLVSLKEAISERKLTITKAAKILGITRQALHLHLAEEPKHQLRWRAVGRAVRAWELVIYAQGEKFDKDAFGNEPAKQDTSVQLLLLPEAISRVHDA